MKKIWKISLLAASSLSGFFLLENPVNGEAKVIETSGLKASDATIVDTKGKVHSHTEVLPENLEYRVKYKWSVARGIKIATGDTTYFYIPLNVRIPEDEEFPITGVTSTVGTANVTKDNSVGKITFIKPYVAGVGYINLGVRGGGDYSEPEAPGVTEPENPEEPGEPENPEEPGEPENPEEPGEPENPEEPGEPENPEEPGEPENPEEPGEPENPEEPGEPENPEEPGEPENPEEPGEPENPEEPGEPENPEEPGEPENPEYPNEPEPEEPDSGDLEPDEEVPGVTPEPEHPTTEPEHPVVEPENPTTEPEHPTTEPEHPTTEPESPATTQPANENDESSESSQTMSPEAGGQAATGTQATANGQSQSMAAGSMAQLARAAQSQANVANNASHRQVMADNQKKTLPQTGEKTAHRAVALGLGLLLFGLGIVLGYFVLPQRKQH